LGRCSSRGCAGTERHTWQGEFTERLEGATATVEERLPELQPSAGREKMFIAGLEIGRTIGFKFALVKELDPPAGERIEEFEREAAHCATG
jgi:hypothetical protein